MSLLRMAAIVALAQLAAAGAAGTTLGAETHPPAVIDVSVSGGDLTVDIRNAPLAEVLRIIGQKAGLEVTLLGDVSVPVTQSFSGVPLEEGVRRLARGYSMAMTFATPDGGPRREVLAGIWVMGGSSTPGPVSGGQEATAAALNRDGDSGESRALSPGDPKSNGRAADATLHAPTSGWPRGMQALVDEAGRDNEGAIRLLASISASDPDAEVRQQAVATLGRLNGPAVEAALTAALADDDVSVRVRAVRGLRGAGTESAVQSLAAVLIDDTDPRVRLAALSALTSLPGRTMLQGLAQASSDPDALVRETAIRGLAWWKTRLSGRP